MPDGIQVNALLAAAIFAAEKHSGQVRKDQRGSPYITHPLTVAQILWEVGGIQNTEILSAAILHDTLEDTSTTRNELASRFGDFVLTIVLEVTDDKSLPKMERKRRQVLHAPELSHPARLVKLGDKLANCTDVLESPPNDWNLKRRQEYVQWAADVVSQIRGASAALEHAFDAVLIKAETELHYQIQPFETIHQRPWGWSV